jgi:hypothetical protein
MDRNHREILIGEIESIVGSFREERENMRQPLKFARQALEEYMASKDLEALDG